MSELLDAELPEIKLDLSGLDLTALDLPEDSGDLAASSQLQQAEPVLEELPADYLSATEGREAAYAGAELDAGEACPADLSVAGEAWSESGAEEEMWKPASPSWAEEAAVAAEQAEDFSQDYRTAALLQANMIESSLDGLPEDDSADAFEGRGRRGASIEITAATEDDLEDIIELGASLAPCSMSPFRPVPEERVVSDRRTDLQSVYRFINNDDFGAFVARDAKGNYIGHVLVKSGLNDFLTGEAQAWVFDISVQPKYWGSGISKRLLLTAERFARERGIKYLGLTVTAANARALRFYQRAGYQEERYQMVKILPPLDPE